MRDTNSQRQSDATDAEPNDHHAADAPPADHHATDQQPTAHPRDAAAPHPRDGTAPNPRADGGAVATGDVAAAGHDDVDYLEREVNIFSPSTPFMRDHLRVVWAMFAAWALVVFGPVTATALAPDAMTSITVLGFPLHYALTAIGAPGGALVLSLVYARKRDQLDRKYGIDHAASDETTGDEAPSDDDAATEPTATDGGVDG